jgi:uncharacterized protein (TIGR02246 family)
VSVKVFTAFNVAEASGPVVGLFRPDAIWTTGGGLRLTGRDEISAFTHQVLPRANRDSTATYEVVQVLFIRLDVAAVKVRQRPVTLDRQPIEDQHEGSPLYVMSKEDGRWNIVVGPSTASSTAARCASYRRSTWARLRSSTGRAGFTRPAVCLWSSDGLRGRRPKRPQQ